MKQERPPISLVNDNDDVKDRGRRKDIPGDQPGSDHHEKPGKPGRYIKNTDPNAAENQPERGKEKPLPTPR